MSTPTEDYDLTVQWAGFLQDIDKFNEMYKLPSPSTPTLEFMRLEGFKKIISEEVTEIDDIIAKAAMAPEMKSKEEAEDLTAAILTDLGDWLGDIVVYCTSEMRRYGLKPTAILEIIMQSNFSKLDAEGNPIYDPETGKVLKGPGYWKPEPKIRNWIESKMDRGTGYPTEGMV